MEIKEILNEIPVQCEIAAIGNNSVVPVMKLVDQFFKIIREQGSYNDNLIAILDIVRNVALNRRRNSQVIEEHLLRYIRYTPFALWENDDTGFSKKFERGEATEEGQIAEILIKFVKEMYALTIARDSFSGKRRDAALDILLNLSNFFDVPEFMELCTNSIKSKKGGEFAGAIDTLTQYYLNRNELPSDDIINIVDKRIREAKTKSEAAAGLKLYYDLEMIDEIGLLFRLTQWKKGLESRAK